ncbi:MAG: ATP-dependent Clp protease ATP-binding subunit [Planctomycetes bacterium]|nr:ATP-dependent Clp protease ATP-binding subunit [Planctomycetota bacterium]
MAALHAAAERAPGRMRVGDILDGAFVAGGTTMLAVIQCGLPPRTTLANLRDLVGAVAPARHGQDPRFDGTRAAFTPGALAAVDSLAGNPELAAATAERWTLELLTATALGHLDPRDAQALVRVGVDLTKVMDCLRATIARLQAPPRALFDDQGRLRAGELTARAFTVLREAAREADRMGADRVLPQHLFLALLADVEGVLEPAIRVLAAPGSGPARVRELIVTAFTVGPMRAAEIGVDREGMANAVVQILQLAAGRATAAGRQEIDAADLTGAVLQRLPPAMAGLLGESAGLAIPQLLAQVEKLQITIPAAAEVPFRLPGSVGPSEDLTCLARQGRVAPAIGFEAFVEPVDRALHRRRDGHVLIVGDDGVGKTTLLGEIARLGATGALSSLGRRRVVRVDCAFVEPRESAARLQALLAHVDGRSDVVLALDDLGPLLRGEDGASNSLALRAALQQERTRLIATVTVADHEELFTSAPDLARMFTRIDLVEPTRPVLREIVARHADRLAGELAVRIDADALDRAIVLPAEYILNERMPQKALRILRRVCEDVEFDRGRGRDAAERVTAARVIAAVAEVSGVPAATLAGVTDVADYEGELRRMVLGQEKAITAMAADLRRIKAGRKKPGSGPAGVVLFAGLTGTGKTELAKAVARLYSSSKRLQVYTMANFTEPHSVAGLIGSPVGYHGHDQGGPLINALNADPFGVFLLDEAEKAHPNVWKPFLNLFAEGWIVDTRGVKAWADRSIFILTSNAGAEEVAALVAAGRPQGQVVEAAKEALRRVRHPQTKEIVFSPEFLARLDRVIIFRSLDREAMGGVTRLAAARLAADYKERRGKELVVADALLDEIASIAHAANERSGWKEGGRVANRLVSEYVDDRIQAAELTASSWQLAANHIAVDIDPGSMSGVPGVVVRFEDVPAPGPAAVAAATARELEAWITAQAPSALPLRALTRIEDLSLHLASLALPMDAADLVAIRERLQRETERGLAAVREVIQVVTRDLLRRGGG